MGFTREQLASYRGGTLPDLLGAHVRLLFVGINPGLLTVATQSHFSRRGNRFYPAIHAAGIVDHVIDASAGFDPADLAQLHERGIGITSLVARATARADELEPRELEDGAKALVERVAAIEPAVVAILGVTAYRVAFAEPRAVTGRQPSQIAGAQLWVVPNPSGLNAHETVASLAAAYRAVAIAAGIDVHLTNPGVSASRVGTPREGTSG